MTTKRSYTKQVETLVNEAVTDLQATVKSAAQTALDVTNAARKTSLDILRAGVGAYLTVTDEAGQTYSSLIARGEQVTWPGELAERPLAFAKQQLTTVEQQADDVVEAAKARAARIEARAEAGVKQVETQFERAVAEALHRLGVPTRHDVQSLQTTIAKLDRQVTDLRRS